jgi:hypothetical protein
MHANTSAAFLWHAIMQVEVLQGNIALITGHTDRGFPFLLQAVIGCYKKDLYPQLQMYHTKGVNLSSVPNSNHPVHNLDEDGKENTRYSALGLAVVLPKDTTEEQLYTHVHAVMKWCNTHRYERDKQTNKSVIKTMSPFTTFFINKADLDITRSPMRKMSDMIQVDDVVDFLVEFNPTIFNSNFYYDFPHLADCYFDVPYPSSAQQFLGYPDSGAETH